MKKGATIICAAFMIMGAFLIIKWIPEASATTWTVGPGQQFQTIGQALAVARSGDDIQVQCGTYNENLFITTQGISIIGVPNNGARPIIQALNPSLAVVHVGANGFFMEQFVITGGSYGIYSNQVTGNQANPITFFMCEIYNNNVGIGIVNGAYHYIDYCDVHSNAQDGIQISGTHHEITSSNIYENGGHGIYSDSLSQSKISSCNVCTNVNSGIYIFNANNNQLWATNIYHNNWEGLYISGDNNDIDGYGVASIFNNYYSGSVGDTYDVWINGDHNAITDYEVYQDPERNFQNRYGIYSAGPGNIYGNEIIDCNVHGYDGMNCAGVSIDFPDKVLGYLTCIYDNNIGLVMGAETKLDCYNTQYQANSENFKDNNISIVVEGYWAWINHTYIRTTGSSDGRIGIRFVSGMKMSIVNDSKIENMEIGIEIPYSNPDDPVFPSSESYNQIYYCEITNCRTGIEIDEGNYDVISRSEITECEIGISLMDSFKVVINHTSFESNYGNDLSEVNAGIYISGGSHNLIDSCTMENHYKSIWLCDGSSNNEINNTDISDHTLGGISSGTWGEDDVEIGIYLHHSANNNITEVDFTYLGYCVGINASTDINIIGKFPNENEMKYIQYEVVYAVNDSTNISSGKIHYYGEVGSSYSVYLRGYDEDTKTLFVYHNLYGTWTISGSYYTWTTYQ
ncbi:MAG: right-handed parallel beta-helix repeat-containing protein [Candidatus Thermoplasmatota archaeon]|nr:right-handed parallel beta-helix repeat-containing protein [Candidatus Thermoplasmatota archaeon]